MEITYSIMQATCPACHTTYANGQQIYNSEIGTIERWTGGHAHYMFLPPCPCGAADEPEITYEPLVQQASS